MSLRRGRSRAGENRKSQGGLLARKDDAVHWFQREGFAPAEFLARFHSERELDAARHELQHLNDYCKQEVQKVVHAHHKDFLDAARHFGEVEGLMDELRNYVYGSASVVANLEDSPSLTAQVPAASAPLPPLPAPAAGDDGGSQQPSNEWEGILAVQAELLRDLQIAVRERSYVTARALLAAGRDLVALVERDAGVLSEQASAGGGGGIPTWRYGMECALAAQKAAALEDLQRQLSTTNSSTLERRQAAQVLGALVGPARAAAALLRCHSLRLRAAQQHLLKQHSAAGGDPDGVEYAGGLAQHTFLAIGEAAEDARAVFPAPLAADASPPGAPAAPAAAAALPAVAALAVQWACDEARTCADLLRRHALAPFAATGGSVGAMLCCGLAAVFCAALERTHGLALRVAFLGELWPQLEAILQRHLHRLREQAAAATLVDATNAALQATAGGGVGDIGPADGANGLAGTANGHAEGDPGAEHLHLPTLFTTAAPPPPPAGLSALPALLPELRALAEGLAPLASPQAAALLRQGVVSAYGAICQQAAAALQRLAATGGAAGGGGGGPAAAAAAAAAARRPLLAAYVARVERLLRQFAEHDVQEALEPLAAVTGPVVPTDLLLPSVAPLADLLSSLPPPPVEAPPAAPAAPAAPAGGESSAPRALRQQSSELGSGSLDRMRWELEAESERRQGQREARRAADARVAAAAEASVAAAEAAAEREAGAAADGATARHARRAEARATESDTDAAARGKPWRTDAAEAAGRAGSQPTGRQQRPPAAAADVEDVPQQPQLARGAAAAGASEGERGARSRRHRVTWAVDDAERADGGDGDARAAAAAEAAAEAVAEAAAERRRAAQMREERERAERERAEQEEAAERERAEREQARRERAAQERAARARAEQEQAERERERVEQEQEQAERERVEQEEAERERAEQEEAERARKERQRARRERAAVELAAKEQAEREQAAQEAAARALAERERAEQLRAERARAAREKAEQAEREQAAQEAAARALAERERAEQLRAERSRAAREKAEREQAEREQEEQEERQRAEQAEGERARRRAERAAATAAAAAAEDDNLAPLPRRRTARPGAAEAATGQREPAAASGAGARRPNRFGVVLSDDEDAAPAASRLRRARPGAAVPPAEAPISEDADAQPGHSGLQSRVRARRPVPDADAGEEVLPSSAAQGSRLGSISAAAARTAAAGQEARDEGPRAAAAGEMEGRHLTARERLAARMAAKAAGGGTAQGPRRVRAPASEDDEGML